MDWSGTPVNEPFLRDTVNVPYFSDRMLQVSERAAAHGFSRSEYGRHVRVSLPPAGARGRRHDGTHSRRAREWRRFERCAALNCGACTVAASQSDHADVTTQPRTKVRGAIQREPILGEIRMKLKALSARPRCGACASALRSLALLQFVDRRDVGDAPPATDPVGAIPARRSSTSSSSSARIAVSITCSPPMCRPSGETGLESVVRGHRQERRQPGPNSTRPNSSRHRSDHRRLSAEPAKELVPQRRAAGAAGRRSQAIPTSPDDSLTLAQAIRERPARPTTISTWSRAAPARRRRRPTRASPNVNPCRPVRSS